MDTMCTKCFGLGWVCRSHPDKPWHEDLGCTCDKAMPCKCNEAGEEPDYKEFTDRITRH
jgi:hypothetical protein